MKWGLAVVVALLALGGLAFGGLWLHAASVESGEADRIEVGEYSVEGAHLDGGDRGAAVYSLDLETELDSYESYGVYTAEGPIIAVLQSTGGLVAIDDDGDVAWGMGSAAEGADGHAMAEHDSYWPEAVDSDGSIITRECRREVREITECEMIGIDISGDVKWRTEASIDFHQYPWRSSGTRGGSSPFPLAAQGLDSLYDSDTYTTTVRIFDTDIGETETFEEPPRVSFHGISTIGLAQVVPEEYFADTDEQLCELLIQGNGGEEIATVAHSCHLLNSGFPVGEYVSFGSFDHDWMTRAGLEPSDEMGLLHAATGQWAPTAFPGDVPDELIRSAAGLAERVGDTWYLSGIDELGAEFQYELPRGFDPVAFSSETLVVEAPAESWSE